jgi:hypothetical protein
MSEDTASTSRLLSLATDRGSIGPAAIRRRRHGMCDERTIARTALLVLSYNSQKFQTIWRDSTRADSASPNRVLGEGANLARPVGAKCATVTKIWETKPPSHIQLGPVQNLTPLTLDAEQRTTDDHHHHHHHDRPSRRP